MRGSIRGWGSAALAIVIGVTASDAQSVPPTMQAFVQTSTTNQQFETAAVTPKLGDLHKIYSGLPASCEVLVKVQWSSVNPSDIHATVASSLLPHVLGSDMAGTVVATQQNCSRIKTGDRVYGDIGANTASLSGARTKELGGYGQYAVALESQLGIVPEQLSLEVAGSLPKVALTSLKALYWYAYAKNDSLWKRSPTVMVLGGSGGCGTTGLQLAKSFGAGKLITTTSADNFDYCKALGANVLIDYRSQNWWDVVPDNSVDVIYDTVGQFMTGDRAMSKLREGGHYVTIVGALAQRTKAGVTQHMFINSDTNLDNTDLWTVLNDIVAKGELTMPEVTPYPLSNVSGAFKTSAGGQVRGKLVISLK